MGPERCARCGKCLPVCPTYQITRQETFSPRGRVALYQAGLLQGKALSFCLLCGACEAICPNQVSAVSLILATRKDHPLSRAELVSQTWKALVRLGPKFRERADLPERGKPVLFLGCGGDLLYPETIETLVRFLQKKGFSPALPRAQGCCGLLALSLGAESSFWRQAEQNLSALAEAELIITPCASCLYTLKVLYPRYLSGTPLERMAYQVAERSLEAASFLLSAQLLPPSSSFLFQVPCHLRYIDNAKWWHQMGLVVHEGCCGGGGLFGVRFPKEAKAILKGLNQSLERHRAHELATACTACWLTLKHRHRLPIRMLYEALIVAYC